MKSITIATAVLLGVCLSAPAHGENPLSEGARVKADSLLANTRVSNKISRSSDYFWDGLKILRDATEPSDYAWATEHEGLNARAKMIRFAKDFVEKGPVYDEMYQKHFTSKTTNSVIGPMVDAAPSLPPEILNQSHRLMLEAFMLSPARKKEYDTALSECALGLGAIGDQRSLETFRILVENSKLEESRDLRDAALLGILSIPSERSLAILLGSLPLEQSLVPDEEFTWSEMEVLNIIERFLRSGVSDSSAIEKWLMVFNDFEVGDLDDAKFRTFDKYRLKFNEIAEAPGKTSFE